jgi:ATP-binding cassette subfamily F protein 3
MSACILSVSQLAFEFSGHALFSQLSFQLFEGARTGLLGANGSGKTTLLRLFCGQLPLQQGQIERRALPLYLEQSGKAPDADTLAFETLLAFRPELPPLWRALHEQEYHMADPVAYAEQVAHFAELEGYRYQAQAESMAESFGFVSCDLLRPLASFSGGERRLLQLAAIFAAEPEFLLLDEPTHYLDQNGLAYLLAALKQTRAAVLLVSHDRWFLDQTVDQILLLERGETRLYKGNYSTFSATRAAENLERERQKANWTGKSPNCKRCADIIKSGAISAKRPNMRVPIRALKAPAQPACRASHYRPKSVCMKGLNACRPCAPGWKKPINWNGNVQPFQANWDSM